MNDGDIRDAVIREQYWDGEWLPIARKLPVTAEERYKHLHTAVVNLIARMGRAEHRLDDIQSESMRANECHIPIEWRFGEGTKQVTVQCPVDRVDELKALVKGWREGDE